MPRTSSKNLTSEQKNAIRLIRSASSVTVTVCEYGFSLSRQDAIDAVETGRFNVVTVPTMTDGVMTGFNVYMAPAVQKERDEFAENLEKIGKEFDEFLAAIA